MPPSAADARRYALQVTTVIETAPAAKVPSDRYPYGIVALAAVSRLRAQLLGLIALDDAGRFDMLGLVVRQMFEHWYVGALAILGDQRDLDRLEADHRYWKNELAKHLPGRDPEPGPASKFSVWQRAKRCEELLHDLDDLGTLSEGPVCWYRTLYAGESLTTAHAGYETLKHHVVELQDGRVGIVIEPQDGADLRVGRLLLGTTLLAVLAKLVWNRVGLDSTKFDELDGLEQLVAGD